MQNYYRLQTTFKAIHQQLK